MIVGLAVLGIVATLFLTLMVMGWPMLSRTWQMLARVGAVICGVAFFFILGILIWKLMSPHTIITIDRPRTLELASFFATAVVIVLALYTLIHLKGQPSRTLCQVHYKSIRWIKASKELIVEAALKYNSELMSIENIELRIGRTSVPYKELSRPTVLPLKLPMPISQEQIFRISFVIPDELQGESYRMRLCVIAEGKRYFCKLDDLSLEN